jgi:hypothetical protein
MMDVKYWTHWTHVEEERQAEFLVHDFFPWTAVEAVGVWPRPPQRGFTRKGGRRAIGRL